MTEQLFGDGSDGVVVLGGRNDVPWANRRGRTYILTRDAYPLCLRVRGGVTLATNGYRLLVADELRFPGWAERLFRGRARVQGPPPGSEVTA